MKNSISLIGMAGAGKSTVGKELAKILDFRLIDSDTLIEEQHGKSLQKILEEEGYLKLREIENSVLKNLPLDKTILATGGSAVYSDEAMNHILPSQRKPRSLLSLLSYLQLHLLV